MKSFVEMFLGRIRFVVRFFWKTIRTEEKKQIKARFTWRAHWSLEQPCHIQENWWHVNHGMLPINSSHLWQECCYSDIQPTLSPLPNGQWKWKFCKNLAHKIAGFNRKTATKASIRMTKLQRCKVLIFKIMGASFIIHPRHRRHGIWLLYYRVAAGNPALM